MTETTMQPQRRAGGRLLLGRPLFLAGVGLTIAFLVVVGVLVLRGGDGGEGELKPGKPMQVSVERLRSVAESTAGPVYWAGAAPRLKLELTRTRDGKTFVRYLPKDVPIGDPRAAYTAVGTYPQRRAYQAVQRAAKRRGANSRRLPGSGLAVWRAARPTSVYLAHRGSFAMIEVFARDAREARRLVLSGSVVPVR